MNVRTVVRALWSDGRGWVLLFVTFGWTLSIGTRFIFPVLFPHLREAFDLDLSTLGALYTLVWVAFAVGQFPGGALADRVGERNVLFSSILLSGATVLLVGLSFNILTLAAGMILFGLASALFGTTRLTVLSDIYADYDGTAIGLMQSMAQLGNALLPVTAGSIAIYLTWRSGVLFVVPLFLVVAIGLWTVVPRRTDSSINAVDELSVEALRYVISNVSTGHTLRLAGLLALVFFMIQGLTSFYPTYLIDIKGLTPAAATSLFGLIFVCAAIVEPLSGALGDIFDSRKLLLLLFGVLAVALLLIPFAEGVVHLAIITALLSCLFGIFPTVVTRLTFALPDDMKGTGLGLIRTGYFLVGATGSVVIGTLAERGLFDESFFFLAILVLGAIGLVFSLTDHLE